MNFSRSGRTVRVPFGRLQQFDDIPLHVGQRGAQYSVFPSTTVSEMSVFRIVTTGSPAVAISTITMPKVSEFRERLTTPTDEFGKTSVFSSPRIPREKFDGRNDFPLRIRYEKGMNCFS